MISLPIGILAMITIMTFVLGGMDVKTVLNTHAFLLVFFGTGAVLALSTPVQGIKGLWIALMSLRKKEDSESVINQELIRLSKDKVTHSESLHPLIRYASSLWEQGLDADTITELLNQKVDELNREAKDAVTTMRNLAKYPPALGMTGTVVGLVALFSSLTAENRGNIGPSLALALTATFYGLILANTILMPLADRLQVSHQTQAKLNERIFNVLILIHEGKPASIIKEKLDDQAA